MLAVKMAATLDLWELTLVVRMVDVLAVLRAVLSVVLKAVQ